MRKSQVLWKRLLATMETKDPLPLIFQAPMAGGMTGVALVSAVCNAGCVGSVGAGYMQPEQLRSLIRNIRVRTVSPFNVNLMVPGNPRFCIQQIERMAKRLQPYYAELGITPPTLPNEDTSNALFEEQFRVVYEEKVPIVSFVFGIPSKQKLQDLKAQNVLVIGTATTLAEGQLIEEAGFGAVVAQGAEAGGHRGTFADQNEPTLIDLHDLVPSLVKNLHIPVVAAGGIMDGRDIMAVLAQGAAAVQMGTAFLVTDESEATTVYKSALIHSQERVTTLTRAFSGKWARGLVNRFTEEMSSLPYNDIPDYPIQNALTTPLRKEAAHQSQSDFLALWAGTGHARCRQESVKQLVGRLVRECDSVGNQK